MSEDSVYYDRDKFHLQVAKVLYFIPIGLLPLGRPSIAVG